MKLRLLAFACKVKINPNFAFNCIAKSPISEDHMITNGNHFREVTAINVPFANGLLEGPFVKAIGCTLSFGLEPVLPS